MGKDTRTLGLISRPIVNKWGQRESAFGYETLKLIQAGRKIYGNVILINPFLIAVELPRESDSPMLLHDGQPLPRIDSLIIRSTYRLGPGLTATVRCLRMQGCDILDPVTRQGRTGASKLSTSIKRFKKGVGSSTFLAFSREAALDLANRLSESGRLPLIGKPIDGRGGKGILRLDSPDDLLRYVNDLYRKRKNATILLQPFEEFINEFRVIVFFSRSLGIARKIPSEGAIAANVAQGGTFVPADRPDVVEFAVQNVDRVGILGVDVGETRQGEFRIIEANRAPRWEAFDKALKCNTAKEILALARQRLD